MKNEGNVKEQKEKRVILCSLSQVEEDAFINSPCFKRLQDASIGTMNYLFLRYAGGYFNASTDHSDDPGSLSEIILSELSNFLVELSRMGVGSCPYQFEVAVENELIEGPYFDKLTLEEFLEGLSQSIEMVLGENYDDVYQLYKAIAVSAHEKRSL